MAQHVYHWKHGWIPLDHAAALSKAKGNHDLAATYLRDAHSPGAGIHSRQDVAKALRGIPSIGDAGERRMAMDHVSAAAGRHGAADLVPTSHGSIHAVAPTHSVEAADVKAGDILHSPGLGDKVDRLRVDKAYPAWGGHPNVDVTDLATGRKHQLSLENFKRHTVERAAH